MRSIYMGARHVQATTLLPVDLPTASLVSPPTSSGSLALTPGDRTSTPARVIRHSDASRFRWPLRWWGVVLAGVSNLSASSWLCVGYWGGDCTNVELRLPHNRPE